MATPYIPFGPEWEKEMMKFSKSELITMLRKMFIEFGSSKIIPIPPDNLYLTCDKCKVKTPHTPMHYNGTTSIYRCTYCETHQEIYTDLKLFYSNDNDKEKNS